MIQAHGRRATAGRRDVGVIGIVGLAIVLIAAGWGCETKTSDRDIAFMNVDELRELLSKENERTLVVDVRRWGEYDAGHIPGAVCIPVAELGKNDPVLAGASQIVVYAGSYESPLSPAAAKKLIAVGYDNVYDFRGGLEYWVLEGGEVETTPAWVMQGSSALGAGGEAVGDAGSTVGNDASVAPLPTE